MYTIGGDIHLRTSTFCVLDAQGNKVARKKLENDPDDILAFIRDVPSPKQVSVEATYNWQVFYDLLQGEVDSFVLLHPKKLRQIVESQSKNDNKDSELLAELTWRGRVPQAYTSNAETRQFRRLLQARVKTSQQIASIKNRIHAYINATVWYSQRPKNFKDLFCKRGIEYLRTVKLPDNERFIIDTLLKQIEELEKTKRAFDEYIEQVDYHSTDIALLSTVPGLKRGKLLKYIIGSEIDQIARFRNARALIAYAGLVPKERSSGDKLRYGKLRTECNTFLRWAIIEACLGAILADKGLKAYYKEVKLRSNASNAKVACARKLLTAIYHVIKEQRPYFNFSDNHR